MFVVHRERALGRSWVVSVSEHAAYMLSSGLEADCMLVVRIRYVS